MFTEDQLEQIQELGKEGFSINVVAATLGFTFDEFCEQYSESKEAVLAYEKGRAELEVEAVTLAKIKMKDGDQKSFEFITGDVLNMSGKSKSSMPAPKSKKTAIPSMLLDPSKLLEMDDAELQRKIELKRMEEDAKKPKQTQEEEKEDKDE